MKDLNVKQRKFVAEYMKDCNGKQAAIRAGYSAATAEVQASRLLRHVQVKAAIDVKVGKIEEKALVTKEFVIGGFKDVAERCMQAKPVMVFDREEKRMVQKMVEVDDPKTGETREVGSWEFDSAGANGALKALGSHLGLFQGEKVTVEMRFVVEVVQKVQEVLNRTIPDNCPHCKKILALRPETIRQLEALTAVM